MEPFITTNLLMNVITGLLTAVVMLAVWFVQFYVKTERCKASRKEKELDEEKTTRKEFAKVIFEKIDEFGKTIVVHGAQIENLRKDVHEVRVDIKELEQRIK